MERVGSTMFSLRKHISEKYGYSAQGQRRMYCHHCSRTFITLDHVNTTPRRTHLALMIDQGASLADIRKLLLLNSTGLNRELMKLAREVNYKESYQYSSASDISLSTRAFRVSLTVVITIFIALLPQKNKAVESSLFQQIILHQR